MQRKISLNLILISASALAIFHIVGTYFYMYWREPGFDRVVHLLGGFFVTILSLGVASLISKNSSRIAIPVVGIIIAIAVGIVWEFFELGIGETDMNLVGFWGNTTSDILSDAVGGCLAVIYTYVPKK